MKTQLKILLILFFSLNTVTACKKVSNVLPEREKRPEVPEVAAQYVEILSGSKDGWILTYKPERYPDSIKMHLKFKGEEVNMLSGYRGYHDKFDTTSYSFEGKFSPVINFSKNSIFGMLAAEFNGFYKFKISYNHESNNFDLRRADGLTDHIFPLRKANEGSFLGLNAQIDSIFAQIAFEEEQELLLKQIKERFTDFAGFESDFYFYNIRTDNFSAAINSIDTLNNTIDITYKVTPVSAPTNVISNYSFYPKGMVLSPAISYSGIMVDTLELGSLEDPVINILRAGNAGVGKMGYMHNAPYEFTLSTNRNITLADYLLEEYPSYLQSSGRLSDEALTHSDVLRSYVDTETSYKTDDRWLFYIYAPKYTVPSIASSFYVGAQKSDGSVGNFRYDVTMESASGNKLIMNKLTRQVVPSPVTEPELNITDRVQEFMNEVNPAAGTVPVPYNMAEEGSSGYRLRLLSSEDSRIWVEYRWLNATYWNKIFD